MVQFINISSCYSCIWFTSLIKDALCITICCILLVMYIYIFVFHLNILFMYNKCIDKITIIVSHILSIFYFNIIFPSCNNCNYTVKLLFYNLVYKDISARVHQEFHIYLVFVIISWILICLNSRLIVSKFFHNKYCFI